MTKYITTTPETITRNTWSHDPKGFDAVSSGTTLSYARNWLWGEGVSIALGADLGAEVAQCVEGGPSPIGHGTLEYYDGQDVHTMETYEGFGPMLNNLVIEIVELREAALEVLRAR